MAGNILRLHTGVARIRTGHSTVAFDFPDDWYRRQIRGDYRYMRRQGVADATARMVVLDMLIIGRRAGRTEA